MQNCSQGTRCTVPGAARQQLVACHTRCVATCRPFRHVQNRSGSQLLSLLHACSGYQLNLFLPCVLLLFESPLFTCASGCSNRKPAHVACSSTTEQTVVQQLDRRALLLALVAVPGLAQLQPSYAATGADTAQGMLLCNW